MLSQLTCLYVMVQLQKVIGYAHKISFHHDMGAPSCQESAEPLLDAVSAVAGSGLKNAILC